MRFAIPTRLFFCLSLLLSVHVFAEEDFTVLPLYYRSADELIPILQSIFGTRARFSHLQDKLVVSTEAKNLPNITKLLRELDHKPKMLLLSFKHGAQSNVETTGVGIDASASVSKVSGVKIGQKPTDSAGAGRVEVGGSGAQVGMQAASHERVLQGGGVGELRVLEGAWGSILSASESSLQGMQAQARTQGASATIQFRQQSAMSTKSQSADSSVSGKMGDWIPVASIVQSSGAAQSGLGSGAKSNAGSSSDLYVRVTELRK